MGTLSVSKFKYVGFIEEDKPVVRAVKGIVHFRAARRAWRRQTAIIVGAVSSVCPPPPSVP
jgi:hypothetical protein